jgi:xanthine dehydrogenase accessory factor
MSTFYYQLAALERESTAFVLVVLVDALGSTPQDTGAKMIVTPAGLLTGTVGGGRVEAQAIAFAQELLAASATKPRFVNWSLKGDVGMTCGGSVKLYLEPHLTAGPWPIVIFGAGHIVQALVPVLLPLACTVTVIDPRSDWLERLPRARNLQTIVHANPADLIPTLPESAFVICMTKGHASDRPVLQRALAERTFPYLGAIGSTAKAIVLRRELVAHGLTPDRAEKFFCPIGEDFGSNHPHEIALSITAQIIKIRDQLAPAASPVSVASPALD